MKKILAIEDNAVVVRILQQRMPKVEFAIAVHPAESVTKAAEEKPDLIVLDVMLPERSGFDILRELKEKKETKDIPVIIMSALGSEEDIERAMGLGAQDYIVKGMESMNAVTQKIEHLLGEQSPHEEEKVSEEKVPDTFSFLTPFPSLFLHNQEKKECFLLRMICFLCMHIRIFSKKTSRCLFRLRKMAMKQ